MLNFFLLTIKLVLCCLVSTLMFFGILYWVIIDLTNLTPQDITLDQSLLYEDLNSDPLPDSCWWV